MKSAKQPQLTAALIAAFAATTIAHAQTDQPSPSIGNDKEGVLANVDGSVDLWFGPTAPKGHESNWVQTVPGKGWNVVMRLYGPEEAWFEKTWRPGEIEPVK